MRVEIKTLQLVEPFRIAHGASAQRQVLRVFLESGGLMGIGEAPFVPYYQDDPGVVLAWFARADFSQWTQQLDSQFNEDQAGLRVARLAVELARLDLLAKRDSRPLGAFWQERVDVRWGTAPPGCRSLSIPTDLDAFEERVRETGRQFRVLKLKLGSGNTDFDEAVAARARQAAPQVTLFADVNGGWSVDEAVVMMNRLARHRLAFVEQPISHKVGEEGWRELRAKSGGSGLKVVADESAQSIDDLSWLSGLVDGVNVKLLKAGGWHAARVMMQEARKRGLMVLLGCMIESSIGVTAAAHLAGMADWIDLDGHLYVANDDCFGVWYDQGGALHLSDRPGIGVQFKEPSTADSESS